MKSAVVIGAAALQLLVLAYMAAEREVILRTGRTIYLRTAPIDPRDAFRGDYVRLDYEISHATTKRLRDGLRSPKQDDLNRKDVKVYAALKMRGDLATLDYVSDRKPADAEVVLRGRAARGGFGGYNLHVRYGLEAYFVEQGKGLDLERGRRQGEIQIPLEMEVAVSGGGKGVLKGSRWSSLGIGLELETENQVDPNNRWNRAVTNRVTAAAKLILMNTSSNDLAVVDLPQGQSIELGPDTLREWSHNNWIWVNAGKPRPVPTDDDVHILKPGEKYSIRVDFRDPQRFVKRGHEPPRALTGLNDWSEQFRLFYSPPGQDECRRLKHTDIIWHGNLPSRAFGGGGRVD